MMAKLTATHVKRNFSAVLDCVRSGDAFEITHRGVTVAVIGPPSPRLVSSERFREHLAAAPPADEWFAHDLREVRASV
jgi:prevent-host-death family protein